MSETPSPKKKKNIFLVVNKNNSTSNSFIPGVVSHACNPSTLGSHSGWNTRSRVQDRPGQYGETLSLLIIQKLAGHGGSCLQSQLLRRLRQENHLHPGGRGCSELRLCLYCSLGNRARLLLKKKKKIHVWVWRSLAFYRLACSILELGRQFDPV